MAEGDEAVAGPTEDLVAENGRLRATIVELQSENASLRDRISRLESELGRNPENSSKPPRAGPCGAAPELSTAMRISL